MWTFNLLVGWLVRWVQCLCLSLKKTPELQTRPRTAREENGSQLICLHSRIPLWRGSPIPHLPSLPPSLVHDRPRQVWTDVNFWLLSLTRGDMEKFVRFVPDSWDGCHSLGKNMEFWSAGLCSGIIIPGLLVCAPDETEGNLQVPDWVRKFRVFVVHGFPLFVLNAILLDGNKSCWAGRLELIDWLKM